MGTTKKNSTVNEEMKANYNEKTYCEFPTWVPLKEAPFAPSTVLS